MNKVCAIVRRSVEEFGHVEIGVLPDALSGGRAMSQRFWIDVDSRVGDLNNHWCFRGARLLDTEGAQGIIRGDGHFCVHS